ncbi:hypothetical protein ANCCAN_05617 [Ancylostoma caninum]|uniref:Uncharacterized protein n=1 Tax=Ancylostoma caninum TaxID=29170 RepID=A0A368GXM5_ANCCA|nr:hypothetical protein ANCCAN_05617 [Ancylostoma caninum]
MFEVFYSRLISEMNILDAERFCMTVNGEEWSVHIKIGFGILDFGAMKDTFGIPRWTSEFGCHLCKFRGNREGSFHVNWYCEEPLAVPLRDRQSILSDACLSRNGLNGRRTAMHLITPESCPPDALHLISEGLTKDRIRDLVCDSSTMSDMKLHRSDREDLKEALHGIVNYCYSNAFILGLEDLSVMTGSERDALANVLFPVVGAEQLCPKIQASAAIVGYWMVVRAMQMRDVTPDTVDILQRIAGNLKTVLGRISKKMFTLKQHVNILFTEVKELQKDIRMLRMQLSRPHSEIVPEGVQFSYDNVKNEKWVLYAAHPFQNTDLVKHLMEYVPSKRIKHKIYLVIVDFFRKVLKRMCCPPEAIQDYAVRQLGGGKKREISDLPGNILDFLIRFGVAAIGLGAKELENGEIESLRGTSNSFWLRLGPDEIMREAKYNFLMMEKQKWMINTRKAIADALDDLRSYTLQNGELIPPKKISKSNSNYNFYGGQHVHESNSNIEVHTPEMVYEEL